MNLKILDCTLRDGGYYTDWNFSSEFYKKYLKLVSKLPIEFIELGYLSKKDDLIIVKTFGGEIIFKKIKDAILMKGPTTFIYKGNINE